MNERVIVIGRDLFTAAAESRWYMNVVATASPTTLHKLRGVSADRLVIAGLKLNRAEAEPIARVANPCLATTRCDHESYSGLEGPIDDLGRFPEVWGCDGCGHIMIDPESPDSGSSS